MGISRHHRELWRDRDLHFEIKQQNANDLNERLYILDHDTNRKLTNKSNKHDSKQNKERIPSGKNLD